MRTPEDTTKWVYCGSPSRRRRRVRPAGPFVNPGYPLVQTPPARHVVTVLALARGESRSIDELVAGYWHNDADISRIVGIEEGIEDETQARRWLIELSIANLRPPLIESDGRYRLPVPAEQMTLHGERVHLTRATDPTRDRGPMYYRCVCVVDPVTNQYVTWNSACQIHSGAWALEERPRPDDLRLIDQIEARR